MCLPIRHFLRPCRDRSIWEPRLFAPPFVAAEAGLA